MRLRASKFVYLPIGGALAAGLLTSALVLPQTKLAASQDCYGVCASATSLSVSRSAVAANTQQLEEFSVTVGAGANRSGVPTGTVTIQLGPHVVCRIHLSAGHGDCKLGNDQLAAGSYAVAAHYSGDSNFTPSTSRGVHFTVLALSGTELVETRSSVAVSREGEEEFKVKVYEDGHSSVRPTGTVTMTMAPDVVLCRFSLSGGQGHCSLRGWELHAGSHEIEARYSGTAVINPSTSHQVHLTVTRG